MGTGYKRRSKSRGRTWRRKRVRGMRRKGAMRRRRRRKAHTAPRPDAEATYKLRNLMTEAALRIIGRRGILRQARSEE